MKKSFSGALYAGIFSLVLAVSADAALLSRLGGLAVYDTGQNITWLANASAGAGSSFDDGSSNTDGLMSWNNATAWASSLTVGGFNDWRLPTTDAACGSSFNCTNSEMGHLFFTELGVTANNSILTSTDPDLALFSNIQSIGAWTATEVFPGSGSAWRFNLGSGSQGTGGKNTALVAWAVRSDDVLTSTVSEPSMLALSGIGLIGLLGFNRRKQQS